MNEQTKEPAETSVVVDNETLVGLIASALSAIKGKLAIQALALEDLPDNPAILQRYGKAFTLQYSALGTTSWDPFYHDWKAQYQQVQTFLSSAMEDSKARTALASISRHSSDNYMGYKRTYHPEVIAQVQPAINEVVLGLQLWFRNNDAVDRSPTM